MILPSELYENSINDTLKSHRAIYIRFKNTMKGNHVSFNLKCDDSHRILFFKNTRMMCN